MDTPRPGDDNTRTVPVQQFMASPRPGDHNTQKVPLPHFGTIQRDPEPMVLDLTSENIEKIRAIRQQAKKARGALQEKEQPPPPPRPILQERIQMMDVLPQKVLGDATKKTSPSGNSEQQEMKRGENKPFLQGSNKKLTVVTDENQPLNSNTDGVSERKRSIAPLGENKAANHGAKKERVPQFTVVPVLPDDLFAITADRDMMRLVTEDYKKLDTIAAAIAVPKQVPPAPTCEDVLRTSLLPEEIDLEVPKSARKSNWLRDTVSPSKVKNRGSVSPIKPLVSSCSLCAISIAFRCV